MTIMVEDFPESVLESLRSEVRRLGLRDSKAQTIRWACTQFADILAERREAPEARERPCEARSPT